jgi:hypothetical protein
MADRPVTIFLVTVLVLGFFYHMVVVARLRTENRQGQHTTETLALAMSKLEGARNLLDRRAALMNEWVERLSSGKVLHLTADGRHDEFVGRRAKSLTDGVAWVFPLRQEVHRWCRSSLAGEFKMIPYFDDSDRVAAIWFQHETDALAFKMRWY